jgi:hypothetical protein
MVVCSIPLTRRSSCGPTSLPWPLGSFGNARSRGRLSPGCGTADDGAALAAPERVVSTTGVETVTNLAPSLWVDTTGWRLRETVVIVPDDTGSGALTNPTGALLGADGLLYVAEREPRSVKVFSRDGGFVRSVGRTGEGPGEFRYVMLGLQGDTILVQDPSLGRLTRFDGAGNQVDITTSACCMMGPILPVHARGVVSVPIPGGWLRGRPGQLVDTLMLPPEPEFAPPNHWTFSTTSGSRGGGGRLTREPIPYAPSLEATLAPSGMVIWGTTDHFRFVVSRTGRDTLRVIEGRREAVPLTDSLRSRAYELARSGNGVLAYAAPMSALVRPDDIPHHRPVWSGLQGDPAGRLWVAVPDAARRVARLAVFDSTGALLGDLPAPHPRILEGSWTGHELVLLDEDAEGRPVIRIFALDTARASP